MKHSAEAMARFKTTLEEEGYCLVPNAIDDGELSELRETLVKVAAEEVRGETDYTYDDGSNQRVWVLLNKGQVFERLAQNETVLELVEHLLGPGFLLSNINANVTGPGGKPMFLHSDTDY